MRTFLVAWVAVALVLLPLDGMWLYLMKGFYQRETGDLLLASPRIYSAVAFYLVYAGSLAWFAVLPNRDGNLAMAAIAGALIGLTAYGCYDLTNHATIANFGLRIAMTDLAWGIILSAVSAAAGTRLFKVFGGI